MKTLFKTFALAAIASLAITGCIKHEPFGHQTDINGGQGSHSGNGGGNTE